MSTYSMGAPNEKRKIYLRKRVGVLAERALEVLPFDVVIYWISCGRQSVTWSAILPEFRRILCSGTSADYTAYSLACWSLYDFGTEIEACEIDYVIKTLTSIHYNPLEGF